MKILFNIPFKFLEFFLDKSFECSISKSSKTLQFQWQDKAKIYLFQNEIILQNLVIENDNDNDQDEFCFAMLDQKIEKSFLSLIDKNKQVRVKILVNEKSFVINFCSTDENSTIEICLNFHLLNVQLFNVRKSHSSPLATFSLFFHKIVKTMIGPSSQYMSICTDGNISVLEKKTINNSGFHPLKHIHLHKYQRNHIFQNNFIMNKLFLKYLEPKCTQTIELYDDLGIITEKVKTQTFNQSFEKTLVCLNVIVSNYHHSHVSLQSYKRIISERKQFWKLFRILYIGILKPQNENAPIRVLPKDVLRFIISFV